jgi:hypothetical protein
MKITLLVTGTLGDVRPNLALTLGLQELGTLSPLWHQKILNPMLNSSTYHIIL